MPMPTVNSVGAVVAGTGDVSPAPGGSHSVNDIDIIIVQTRDQVASLGVAAGFAELTAISPLGQTNNRLTVFWRRWNGSDGTPTITDPGNHVIARMISISGCKTSGNPWDITGTGTHDTTADTTVSVVGGTTTVADCLIVLCCAQHLPASTGTAVFSGESNADLANLTERIDNSTAQGVGGAIGMWTGEKATAGTFGATTATATSAVRNNAMVALVGAAAGQTITAGQATETDIGQVITPSKLRALGQATETDTAQVVTPMSGGQMVEVDQAVETDIAQPISARKNIAVGQAIETDVAQTITPIATPGVLTKAFRATLDTGSTPQTISWTPGGSWPVNATPKAVVIAVTRLTNAQLDGDGWTGNQSIVIGLGAATAPTVRGSALSTVRGNFSPETHRSLTDDHLISIANQNANTIDAAIDLNSFGNNSVVLDHENFPAGAYEIIGFAIAGEQITEAEVISWLEDDGTQDVSVPHSDPKLAIHFWNGANALDAINSKGAFFLGAQNDQGEEIAFDCTAIPASKLRKMRSDRCIVVEGESVQMSAHSGGMLTNAFRVVWDETPPPTDQQMIFSLVLWGSFRSKIFTSAKPTGSAPQVDDITLGFTGLLAFLVTAQKVAGTTSLADNRGGIGIVDTVDQYAYTWTDEDGANPATVYANLRNNIALTKADNNTPAIEASDVATFTGELLRNTWDPNDAVALQYGGIVLGMESDDGVIAIGLADETDTGQPITAIKTVHVAQATETDVAQPIAAAKTVLVGQAVETSTAQTITHAKTVQVGQATETDVAQPITAVGQNVVAVSQATETDTAQPISGSKTVLLGQATETDLAQTITHSRAVSVGQAIETDIAQPITPPVGYDLPIHGTIRRVDQMGGTITRVDEMRGTITRID